MVRKDLELLYFYVLTYKLHYHIILREKGNVSSCYTPLKMYKQRLSVTPVQHMTTNFSPE